MKRVLVLGAGMVVKPLLDDLGAMMGVEVEVAALNIERARELAADRPRVRAVEMDASDRAELEPAVARADVVLSLLPASFHAAVAEVCLEHRVHLVTSSYVSPEMKALDERARERGVLLLNETGLDPGIDHMAAAHVIRRVRREGGRIQAFASYCGGLPAPDANDNPFRYKFSWSPRGVLLAARSPVRYLQGGRVVERPSPYPPGGPRNMDVAGVGHLETYPTRDSLRYLDLYNLEGEVEDLFRGTLRYPGWHETWSNLLALGLLELEPGNWEGHTYASFLEHHLPPGETGNAACRGGKAGLVERLARRFGVGQDHHLISRLEWLGLLSDRPLPLESLHASPLDVLARRLQVKLQYEPGERDMVLLEHHFVVLYPDGRHRRVRTHLKVFGTAGDDSAMAKTVSYPAALACRLLLDDRISLTGVRIPVAEEIGEPILRGLRRRGIAVEESEESYP